MESPDRDGWERFAEQTYSRVVETDCRTWQSPPPQHRSRFAAIFANMTRLLLSRQPRQVQNWSVPGAIDFFRQFTVGTKYDVCWIDKGYIAVQAQRAGLQPIVVDLMEVMSINTGREVATHGRWNTIFGKLENRKLQRFESQLPRQFWRVVVCSPKDRLFFSDAPNVYVVPNGIHPLSALPPRQEMSHYLLFVGAMDYSPNQDAVRWFIDEVLPKILSQYPTAEFHVLGQFPPADITALHDDSTVIIHGRVPSLDEFYSRATVVVAPIRQGSGTRLKVLEALNWGKALVATSTAVEGLALRPGVDFEQADTTGAMAEVCCRLLGSPDARSRLAKSGRDYVLREFQWSQIGNVANTVVAP
jgi:glycosyltransferase involved in cell wall biosynthesis